MATAWDKLEQLLTCAICLDRFRNPKMLPCQHSFCQEPCMEGLQDYARRQIKCPECRAEHRIPFQGLQSYPTNVTLQRFLELHQSITGEEPEPVPSMMERCGVCSEKSTVTKCAHCDKKVCPECKEAHIDILKREISRINHQVRRALNRLQDALSQTERSIERLNVNSVHIRDEIEEIVRRFVKDLKSQEDKMLKDLETYSQVESKNLAKLKEDLAIEYDFLKDNCESAEKNIVDPEKNWNDVELCEVKYIFVKTLDFLRNFDADAADYTRGMKFLPSSELDTLRRNLVNFGELKLLTSEEANGNVRASSPGLTSGSNSLSVPQQSMLMRSQSDHRLATQFARRDSRISDLTSQSRLNPGYSDSEKDPRDSNRATSPSNYSRSRRDDSSRLGRYGVSGVDDGRDSTSRNRFLREADSYRSGWSRDDDSFSSGPQFKSRFMRERGAELSGFDEFDIDPNAYLSRSVRFEEPTTTAPNSVPTPLVKVFDVPEAPRGCLSGIVKISDTAHYMERSHENEVRAKVEKERKEEESRSLPPPSSVPAYQSTQRPRPPSRQVSEDEIEKQKKMNQASAASSVTSNTNSSSLTNNTTATFNSSTTTPSTMGLTSTTTPVNSYGSSITSSNTQSSDSIRPVTRRIGTYRDDEDSRSSSTHRNTTDNTSSTRRSDNNDLTSSLVDDNDDDLGESNLSRLGRRRRGSLSGEDSKESVTSSGRSTQVSTTPASSASTATSGLRPVRAPLAKNLPIAEEEEDRDRDIARKRGPKSSLVSPTASSLGSSTVGEQTNNRNKNDDCTQSMSKFGGFWDNKVVWDKDASEEETEEEEAEEDEEDGEEEEEEIVEDGEEENEEDEEDAEEEEEEEEGEEEEDNGGNGNISREGGQPSSPKPLGLLYDPLPGLEFGYRKHPSRFRQYAKQPEYRLNDARLHQQTLQNATSTQSEQFDKGRENGLPCSVADLLDRSAQVRRDSVELRHRFFEVDRPSSSHEHKPGNTRASMSSQMSALSDQQSQNSSEMPGSSKSNLEDSQTPHRTYRPSRYKLGLSKGGLDSSPRRAKLNRHSSNTVKDKHETPSWSRSKPNNRLSSHARSNINPLTSTSGFDNHNLSTTTVSSSKPLKKSSDRSYYHSSNYHSNPVTGRIISPALTSLNSGPLAASSASASTAASTALSSSSHNYDLSNSRLSRSKSSHLLGVYSSGHDGSDDDDDTSTPSVPTYRSRYAEANYGKEGRYQYRTRQQPKDREKSPTHEENSGNTGTTAWSQYLRNKYGSSRNSSASSTGSGSRAAGLSKSKSSHAVYSRNLSDSSDDEVSTNNSGPVGVPKGALSRKGSLDATETPASTDGRRPSYGYNLPRSTYLQKRRMMFKIGTRGTEPGCFTWPRGIACGPDNSIVVADSSNHRVQVFDSTGRFLHEFGSYGSAEGEFDCLAGVAVNRIGQYIVSDRYNHRVQIFDPSGRFLRSFGCEGRIDGRFSYPWGITTDSLGFIYVCDKENHRIQVFQSDGTFVGKFGSIGNRPGLLEHPHYIAVSNTNRVIVSDSNNHRIQIFDVNGRSLSTFGCEGTEEGQFKFPRGIAVDDQGYIIVGDSGNNRIQIFNPDGTFLKAFGSWGSSEGEFKGLEGVAVSTTGNILVCDRENHRIQVF